MHHSAFDVVHVTVVLEGLMGGKEGVCVIGVSTPTNYPFVSWAVEMTHTHR